MSSTLEQAQANGHKPMTTAADLYVRGLTADERVALHHECQDEYQPDSRQQRPQQPRKQRRVVGLDLARAVAVVGMMAIHILPELDPSGRRSLPWIVASGNAAALFAVLAGLGVGLTTGRQVPPTGRRWAAAVVNLLARTVYIGAVGLAFAFVSTEQALVILPYYALLFLMTIPILRNPAWLNFTVGLLVAVVGPVVSHALRSTPSQLAEVPNLGFGDLLGQPGQTLTTLFLTGSFPAIGWFAYVCIGLGIGRMRLQARRTDISLVAGGAVLAVVANVGSWWLLNRTGGREALAGIASETMPLQEFTDALVWGASGTLPTDTWWWLAVLAPHTTTPFDLLYTGGIALLVLGVCLAVGRVIPDLLGPVATFGSMPLSMYAGHLLLLQTTPYLPFGEAANFLLQVAVLFAFAQLWARWFSKGPLEAVMGWFVDRAEGLVRPRRQAAPPSSAT